MGEKPDYNQRKHNFFFMTNSTLWITILASVGWGCHFIHWLKIQKGGNELKCHNADCTKLSLKCFISWLLIKVRFFPSFFILKVEIQASWLTGCRKPNEQYNASWVDSRHGTSYSYPHAASVLQWSAVWVRGEVPARLLSQWVQ